MTSNYPRFMLAAPKSGSGKTIITCGILKLFSDLGISCRAYKCGPDYIDPLFHKFVQGIDGGNLDTWFQPESQLLSQFMEISQGASVSVVEGVMGYYDGMGGNTTTASSYEVARVLDCPVILILDCRGASLSLSAVAKGFLEYREDSRIKGVILNRISRSMVPRLTVEMEKLGLPVLGWVEECKEAVLESRHLGLVLPQEQSRLEIELEAFALRIKESLDVERILKLARSASSLTLPEKETGKKQEKKEKRKIKIGVALDEAFCFYYQENLRLLEKLGAKLVPFSPLKDENLPEGVCGLIFGGGYPELHGCELGENRSMRAAVKQAALEGMPILGECGGFLYLLESLENKEGQKFPMAGVLPGRSYPVNRLSRFGYIEMSVGKTDSEDKVFPYLLPGETIKGHEFHYWDSSCNGSCLWAAKPGQNRGWECVQSEKKAVAGFPHFYYPSNEKFVARWLADCREYGKEKGREGMERI